MRFEWALQAILWVNSEEEIPNWISISNILSHARGEVLQEQSSRAVALNPLEPPVEGVSVSHHCACSSQPFLEYKITVNWVNSIGLPLSVIIKESKRPQCLWNLYSKRRSERERGSQTGHICRSREAAIATATAAAATGGCGLKVLRKASK